MQHNSIKPSSKKGGLVFRGGYHAVLYGVWELVAYAADHLKMLIKS